MTEKQKLESKPMQRPFGALLGSTKRLPLNKNGKLAQYDTFNEAEEEAKKARRVLEEQRSRRKKWVPFSSICDLAHGQFMGMLAPCVYLMLYTGYDMIIAKSAKAGGENSNLSPACVMFIVEVVKVVFSLVTYIVFGSEAWPSIGTLAYYMGALALPAACYSGIMVINISRLRDVNLMQYGIWYQATIFLSILLWFMVFRRKCGVQQSIALLVLFAGCSVHALQPGTMFAGEHAGLWVLGCSLLSAIGCVSNEHFYKRNKAADINLQNVVLYTMTSLCSLLFIISTCRERLTSVQNFFHGFQGDSWILILIQVFSGLAVSQVLKHASVITKCYIMAIGISFQLFLANRSSGLQASMPVAFASFLIGISTLLYFTASMPESHNMQHHMRKEAATNHESSKFYQTQLKWQTAGVLNV